MTDRRWEEKIIIEAVRDCRTPVSAYDLKLRHPGRFRRGTAAALDRLAERGELRRSYYKGVEYFEPAKRKD